MTGPDLLIVDDCRLYREGLAAMMARQRGPASGDRCPDVIKIKDRVHRLARASAGLWRLGRRAKRFRE